MGFFIFNFFIFILFLFLKNQKEERIHRITVLVWPLEIANTNHSRQRSFPPEPTAPASVECERLYLQERAASQQRYFLNPSIPAKSATALWIMSWANKSASSLVTKWWHAGHLLFIWIYPYNPLQGDSALVEGERLRPKK